MDRPLRILYVDDSAGDRALVRDAVEQADSSLILIEAASRQEFETRLEEHRFDVVLSDLNILGFDGLSVIDAIRERGLNTPIIVVTGTGSEELAAETIKRGAVDYVIKTPAQFKRLPHIIRAAFERALLAEERVLTQAAIQQREALYQAVHEHAPVGIVHGTLDGRYTMVNPFFCEMLGRNADELRGLTFVDVTHPDDVSSSAEQVQHALATGGGYSMEKRFVKADGSVLWVNLHVSLVKNTAGEPLFFVGIVVDIDERKAAEAALAASEAEHRLAQKVAHIGHWALDLSRMTPSWSDEVFRIFGLDASIDEPSFENHQKVTHPDDWPILNGAVMAAVECGVPFDIKFRIIRPDTEVRWMHAIGQVKIGDDGKTENVFGTAQDITLQKKGEQALQERELQLLRLAARLQAVREDERLSLARELHDQLGEKLTGIKMDLDWIGVKAEEQNDVVTGHARSAAGLVEESMELVHEVCTRLRPPMLDILGLRSTIEWYVSEFGARNRIACEVVLDGDDVQLGGEASTAAFRILQEALTNVLRHSQATSVKIKLESALDGGVELSIVDDGVGISDERRQHSDSLGLLGMTERAAVFGGSVRISKGRAGGTEVALWLPLAEMQQTDSPSLPGGGR